VSERNTLAYLLGPMQGYPDLNHPAFNEAAAVLKEAGFDVVNPAALDVKLGHESTYTDYYARDLIFLAPCHLGIALPGWRKSKGATMEAAILSHLERPILEYPSLKPIRSTDLPRVVHPSTVGVP
jgi:hypothetical protein